MVWSYILDYENEKNPFRERQEQIGKWKKYASMDMEADHDIIQLANSLHHLGLKKYDALHLACAIKSGADYFLTTDKGILNKAEAIKAIQVKDPIDFIREVFA